ncbi:tetratricopeptide repeat protein [Desulfolithobacter sp.]
MNTPSEAIDLEELYRRAVDLHQAGDCASAADLYEQLLGMIPQAAPVYYNLGLARYELELYREAAEAFHRAVELNREDVDSWYNLGLALKQCHEFSRAEEAYLKALALHPKDAEVLYNLACCYKDSDQISLAMDVYEHLIELKPDHVSGLNNLAYLKHLHGHFEEARKLYGLLLKLQPDHPSARHMFGALSGDNPGSAPREYVRDLFDQYSDNFEQHLVLDLGYDLPLKMRAVFDRFDGRRSHYELGLDLGCGTGLAGMAFQGVCSRLDGIDLSEKMIVMARKKRIYQHLHVGDIVEYLRSVDVCYDLFLAADVLIYMGALDEFFQVLAGRARPGGLFLFSTEYLEKGEWKLQPSGRYAYHPEYIRKVGEQTGWTVACREDVPTRKERHQWIRGNVFGLIRRG